MIKDLDKTLKKLLQKDLKQVLDMVPAISFATPDGQFPPQSVNLPAIDMFLYDVRENLELRSNEFYVERHNDGTATKTPAPPRVDFSYLVTAWPSPSVKEPAEDEHDLLGEVMRVLLKYRTIPEEVLHGRLVSQDPVLPVATLHSGRLQSLGEFWQALGGKPKAALNYQVTLAIESAEPKHVHIVTDKLIKLRMQKRTEV